MTTSVFILDDHEVVRRGLRSLLEAEEDLRVVGEASTAKDAVAEVPRVAPDVALLDVRLPDGNGVDVCRELLGLAPGLKCLMFSGHIDRDALRDAVLAGASGCLLKSAPEPALIAAIRRVAAGDTVLDPALALDTVDESRRGSTNGGPFKVLTAQEGRVAALVAAGRSNQQIAMELSLSEQTVKNYMSNIFQKTGFANRTELALWVTRMNTNGHLEAAQTGGA